MHILPLLIVSSTALGLGYCCLDVYRNRHRLSPQQKPTVDLAGCEIIPIPDGDDLHTVGQAVTHISHAAEHCASDGVGKCVEAVAHSLFHH